VRGGQDRAPEQARPHGIANNTAKPGKGIGKLVAAKLVRKVIASHIDLNPETQPNWICSSCRKAPERIRAGGFGLGCILTRTGIGTLLQDGKQPVKWTARTSSSKPRSALIRLLQAFNRRLSGQSRLCADSSQFQSGYCDGRRHGDRQCRQHRITIAGSTVAHERHACHWNLTVFTKCCRPFSIS
jgi:hypothetical protein